MNVSERLDHAAGKSHVLDEPEDVDPDGPGSNQFSEHDGDQPRCSPCRNDHPRPNRHHQPRYLRGAADESPRSLLVGIRQDVEAADRDIVRAARIGARKLDIQPVECVK